MPDRCDRLEHLHSAWVDGELRTVERARLATHLQACSRCRAAIHGLRVTRNLLAGMPTRTLPPAVIATDMPVQRRRRAILAPLRKVAARSMAGVVGLALALTVAAFAVGADTPTQPAVPVPVDVYVADHLVRAVGGPASTPALSEQP